MDNRYYNQNPQVTVLLEKIEEQERKIKELNEENDLNKTKYAIMESQFNTLRSIMSSFEILFNALPWYKKMVYKFKL